MKYSIYLFYILGIMMYAQNQSPETLGDVPKQHLEMSVYSKDSLADALVLYEEAKVYLDEKNDYKFRTDYFFRIKIFNEEGYNRANIKIPLYKDEVIKNIKGLTHNSQKGKVTKTYLMSDAIYDTIVDDYWSETLLTLPNVQDGSVIEYSYSIISPYSRLDDWYFQSDIPKLESHYEAKILANYEYKARLYGYQELEYKDLRIKHDCVQITGLNSADCIIYAYGMKDIPAFEVEDYMLSPKNYTSRLVLDLLTYKEVDGGVKRYIETWEDADKSIKSLYLDNQLSKERFFKNKLPEVLSSLENELLKAKKVYKFTQQHLYWNGLNWTREKLRLKQVLEEGSGSVDAINLILYNYLQAAGIESYVVASSTRANGLPTKVYPITRDFNYILVKAVVDGKTYFLDASDKKLAFGQLPLKCLNGEGRVLDFNAGGYWETIVSNAPYASKVRADLSVTDENEIEGIMYVSRSGYAGLYEREKAVGISEDDYLDKFESNNPHLSVNSYEIQNSNDPEKVLIQKYQLLVESFKNENTIKFNPFIYERHTYNPFKLKERKYAVDFGYPQSYLYSVRIKIPEDYEVYELPETNSLNLPAGGGRYEQNIKVEDGNILIFSQLNILKRTFFSEEYSALKNFYNEMIKLQGLGIGLRKTS